VARSFGAGLDHVRLERDRLATLITHAGRHVDVRELTPADVDAMLALDAATAADYPGGIATRHCPLDRSTATPRSARRAFGALSPAGALVAMTVVDLDGDTAETDFTVVEAGWRRRGIGVAVKAASLLTLDADGVRRFRTGGSADNAAIIAANTTLGYVRDEEWLTLAPPTTERSETDASRRTTATPDAWR
jgi:GNAT superfamily N-acetyltransferase